MDFANYPFLKVVCGGLVEEGVDIEYIYNGSYPSPNFKGTIDSPLTRTWETEVNVDGEFQKHSFLRRLHQEIQWTHKCISHLESTRPEILVSANAPLEVQRRLISWCQHNNVKFIFWVQDLHGLAIRKILNRKMPVLGNIIGSYYERLEHNLLSRSDHVILISDDHALIAKRLGIADDRLSVMCNWATLEDLPILPKDNIWSRGNGLARTKNIVYSGTLGMKHNPDQLLNLAKSLRYRSDTRIVVISEGLGANWLHEQKRKLRLDNLVLLPFQPYDQLSSVLATADILTAVLDEEASEFSVPSKIFTYLCAGRPILLGVQASNLAARVVSEAKAGVVVSPADSLGYSAAAIRLLDDIKMRARMGSNARSFAQREFSSELICRKFRRILEACLGMK